MNEVVTQEKMPWNSADRRHIVGLDGLRALAVIAVIAYHITPTWLPGGFIGVDIFFVISGFIITTLLVSEHNRAQRISVKQFWKRRIKRIVPALLTVVCIVSSIAFFIHGDILVGVGRQILGALTFSSNWLEIIAGTNYFDASSPHLFTNFWSLAVEEQFYVIWPLFVIMLLSVPFFAKHLKRAMAVCVLLALGSALLMTFLFQHTTATRVYYGTDTHLFGLMLGAALAFWGQARAAKLPQRRLQLPLHLPLIKIPVQYIGILSLAGLCMLMLFISEQSTFTYDGGLFLASLLSCLLILATISAKGLLQRLFSLKPLEWIGVRSYALYLWHWPALVLLKTLLPKVTPFWEIATLTYIVTLVAAMISYSILEAPIKHHGVRRLIHRLIRREAVIVDQTITRWRLRVHPLLVPGLVGVALTITAVITAPSQTQAEQRIEAGQAAIQKAMILAKKQAIINALKPKRVNLPSSIGGNDMTLIGDSVALASAPALEATFPGILIDAKVSRALRTGGFDEINTLDTSNNLRKVVIIGLATNGYFGNGNLEALMNELGKERVVIFVTGYAPGDSWVTNNNDYIHQIAKQYPNIYIAEWDTVISNHPDEIGPDGIHPDTPPGEQLYADCISTALAQAKQPH